MIISNILLLHQMFQANILLWRNAMRAWRSRCRREAVRAEGL